jgi:hypothetical protein
MGKGQIFAVTTKVGVITRTSLTKEYKYAIVTASGFVSAWCSRYDLAVTAAKGTTWANGGEIVEVVKLDKEPKDPNPGVTIAKARTTVDNYLTIITDTDGGRYLMASGHDFSIATEGTVEVGSLIKGYLERLAIMYHFKSWKAEQAASNEVEANRGSKLDDVKAQKLHDIEVGNVKPAAGVSFHSGKHQWEVKPCVQGKRYFAGYYKKENLDAANQAAVAVKAAGDKAQDVADYWKQLRKDKAL